MAKGKGKASQTAVWIILGLLVVSLMGFGATSFTGGGAAVARVGSAEVTVQDYAAGLNQELRALQAQTRRAIPLSEARQFGIDQAVLSRLVGAAALQDQASQAGVSVGNTRIAEEISSNRAFIDNSGAFNREVYQSTLERSGITVSDYEDTLRSDISSQIVQAAIAGGIAAPAPYVDALMTFLREERDVTWAEITEAHLAEPVPEPTEAELETFHADNAEMFTLAETKVLTIAALTPDMLIDGVEIDEAMLQEIFEERRDSLETPERRLVERLFFLEQADADAAWARLDGGEVTFDGLVEERGITLADVDLGDVTERDLGGAGAEVFALDAPGLVGPVEDNGRFAILRMNAIFPTTSVTFDEVRDELREEIAADRARRVILDEISPVDDLLAGGATLEELAGETELTLTGLDWRPGVDAGLAGYEAIRQAAAQVTDGDFPEIIELEDGGIAALRLDETRPPALQPLQDVRDDVAAAWRTQELSFRLAARAAEIAEAGIDTPAPGGAPLFGTDTGLFRSGFIDGTPATFLPTLFEMVPGETRVIEAPGQAFVARLDAVHPPAEDDEDGAQIRAALSGQVAQSLANDLLIGFMEAARDSAGVDIDQAAINAVHSQFP
ncbi:MAG: SurA N-terminal domain-containing protein [Pseudomonadota bacterium]